MNENSSAYLDKDYSLINWQEIDFLTLLLIIIVIALAASLLASLIGGNLPNVSGSGRGPIRGQEQTGAVNSKESNEGIPRLKPNRYDNPVSNIIDPFNRQNQLSDPKGNLGAPREYAQEALKKIGQVKPKDNSALSSRINDHPAMREGKDPDNPKKFIAVPKEEYVHKRIDQLSIKHLKAKLYREYARHNLIGKVMNIIPHARLVGFYYRLLELTSDYLQEKPDEVFVRMTPNSKFFYELDVSTDILSDFQIEELKQRFTDLINEFIDTTVFPIVPYKVIHGCYEKDPEPPLLDMIGKKKNRAKAGVASPSEAGKKGARVKKSPIEHSTLFVCGDVRRRLAPDVSDFLYYHLRHIESDEKKDLIILIMIMRYASILCNARENFCSQEFYRTLYEKYGIKFEGFASPFNAQLPLYEFNNYGKVIDAQYCSLFEDTDAPFGSLGNFFAYDYSKLSGLYVYCIGTYEIYPIIADIMINLPKDCKFMVLGISSKLQNDAWKSVYIKHGTLYNNSIGYAYPKSMFITQFNHNLTMTDEDLYNLFNDEHQFERYNKVLRTASFELQMMLVIREFYDYKVENCPKEMWRTLIDSFIGRIAIDNVLSGQKMIDVKDGEVYKHILSHLVEGGDYNDFNNKIKQVFKEELSFLSIEYTENISELINNISQKIFSMATGGSTIRLVGRTFRNGVLYLFHSSTVIPMPLFSETFHKIMDYSRSESNIDPMHITSKIAARQIYVMPSHYVRVPYKIVHHIYKYFSLGVEITSTPIESYMFLYHVFDKPAGRFYIDDKIKEQPIDDFCPINIFKPMDLGQVNTVPRKYVKYYTMVPGIEFGKVDFGNYRSSGNFLMVNIEDIKRDFAEIAKVSPNKAVNIFTKIPGNRSWGKHVLERLGQLFECKFKMRLFLLIESRFSAKSASLFEPINQYKKFSGTGNLSSVNHYYMVYANFEKPSDELDYEGILKIFDL